MEDYFESDDFKEMLDQYERAKKTGRPAYLDALDYVDLSDYYLNQDQPRKAMQAINQGLKDFPGDADLIAAKAGAYADDAQYDRARRTLESLPEGVDCPEATYVRARLLLDDDGNLQAADDMFRQWIEEIDAKYSDRLDDDDIIDYRRHAGSQVIAAYYDKLEWALWGEENGKNRKEPEKAEETEWTADLRDCLNTWIRTYLDQWPQMGDWEADFIVADVCRNLQDAEAVEIIYTRLLANDPYTENGWSILASAQCVNNRYTEALDSAAFARAVNPGDERMLRVEADCLFALNHFDRAGDLYQQYLGTDDAREASPGDKASMDARLAYCLIAQGDKETALPHIDKAAEGLRQLRPSAPSGGERDISWLAHQVATNYMLCSQFHKALIASRKSLKYTPENVDALALTALLYMFVGNQKAFGECIKRATEMPDHGAYTLMGLGQRLLILGSYDYADQMFTQLIGLLENGLFDDIDASLHIEAFSSITHYPLNSAYARLALIAYLKEDRQKLRKWLKPAQRYAPDALKDAFNGVLPESLSPDDYYDYLSHL